MLARPDRGMAHERQLLAVCRVAAVGTPVGLDRLFHASVDADFEQGSDGRERPLGSGRREEDPLSVSGPAGDVVIGCVESELLRLAASGGDDVHVVVAVAVGGEGDPVAVGREPRIDIASLVVGNALDARAGVAGDPNVAQVAEGDAAFVVRRVAQQLHVARNGDGEDQAGKGGECVVAHGRNLREMGSSYCALADRSE